MSNRGLYLDMKSPRFAIRADRLKRILKPENLTRTWKAKVRLAMRSQYLCDPIENFDFHINVDLECKKIFDAIMRGEYAPSSGYRVLSEKSKGLCRQVVIPSAQDALVLQCLSDAMYNDIKGKAPTNKAFFEPKDHGFNNKSKLHYGTFSSWMNFQKEIFRFSQNRKYIVVTDIANYYDSISYVHLRNIISSIDGMEECVLDMLVYILAELLWQPDYMPRVEIGLPQIDLDAPRLLAHCFLYELDEYVSLKSNGDFTRFMDDIDVGVDSIKDAKRILQGIDLVLQTRQIRLNGGKTKILSQAEAIWHFRIWDNARLDAMERAVNFAIDFKLPMRAVQKSVAKYFTSGLKSKKFDDGSGEKILKRIIGLAGKSGSKLPLGALEKVLLLRPASRESVYYYISKSPLTPARVKILSQFVRSGTVVDHASYLEMVNVLVESIVESKFEIDDQIKEIGEALADDDYFGFYAAVWLGSKYSDVNDIMGLIKEKWKMWVGDERLGRLIGGLHPIFFNTSVWDEFKSIISKSRNDGARAVYKFHENLRSDAVAFIAMEKFLKSPNESKSTGITHAKFLCLLSALGNESVAPLRRRTLLLINKKVWLDTYYRSAARRSASVKAFV